MNLDRLAPHYQWIETVVFGQQLQRARTAFIHEIGSPRRVLILGEGNGRFLAQFLKAHPAARVDCVEASARMLALARRRVRSRAINFIQADLMETELEPGSYDLIVTHFVLDFFDERTLPPLIEKLACAATAKAQWLVADFCLPAGGWRRRRARLTIAMMYRFFRIAAGLEVQRLVDYSQWLREAQFGLVAEAISPNEMIRSQLWQRSPEPRNLL